MAQQQILAAQRRRNEKAAEAGGFLTEQKRVPITTSVAEALEANKDRIYELFDLWDEDRNGTINEREFRRALKQLGIQPTMAAFHNFLSDADFDGDGEISLQDIELLLAERRQKDSFNKQQALRSRRRDKMQALRKFASWLHGFMNSTTVQTLMYLIIVTCFQLLIESLRSSEEFFLDEMVKTTLLDNMFDENHNDFVKIRRPLDVWEWGSQVLWPGLLGNAGVTMQRGSNLPVPTTHSAAALYHSPPPQHSATAPLL